MSDPWQEVELGGICELKYGKSLPAANRTGGSCPVYGSNGVVGWHSVRLTQGPTIIVGRKGSFGEVHYSKSSCWPIDTTYYIDSSCTKADLRWLSYRLNCLGLTKLNRAAAVPGLNREDAYRQRLLLPPIGEQRRIAAILNKADALRAKRHEAIAKLDELLQSVFLGMFGDPFENPFDWPVCDLGELLDEGPQNGLYKPAKDYGSGTPILRIDGYRAGDVIRSSPSKRVCLTEAEVAKYGLRPLDIVINRVNSPEHLGKPALVQDIQEPTVFESNMMRMAIDKNKALPDYMIAYLVQGFVRNQIATKRKDAINQSSINQGDVKSLKINVPPLALQQHFKSIKDHLIQQRDHVFPSAKLLGDLFNSLQHRAFSGTL